MRIAHKRKQAGDTIVEVLICIGIVSVVLTGAFVVANRSTNGVQDSNEHGQAALQLQTEVELLRSYLATNPTAPASGVAYCMGQGATDHGNLLPLPNAGCSVPYGGATFVNSFTQQQNKYTFTVTWDSISGNKASESFVYRDYAS